MARGGRSRGEETGAVRLLPRPIKLRLADIRRHYEALAFVLEESSDEDFTRAARLGDPVELARHVYPLERAFEILCNYAAELNALGLQEAGIEPEDRPANLRLLVREDVIDGRLARVLRGTLNARNELQHEYPDARAAGIYQAATDLAAELPGYLRCYVAWMRRLGFGQSDVG
jgi:uncharacterized protein YutE (UPF0331/DUF86 family)